MKGIKSKIRRLMFAVLVCVLLANTLFVPGGIADTDTSNRRIGLLIGCPDAIVNNVKTRIDPNDPNVTPIIQDGRTLIPLRFVAECYGANVDWIEDTSTIKIQFERGKVEMVIGSKTMKVNNKEREIDVPAQIIDGRTMVPVRAFADAFEKYTFWDNRGLIIISDLSEKDIVDEYIGKFMVYERVSPEGRMAEHGYFGTCPESPDGKLIAYVLYDNKPAPDAGLSAGLYICDSDLTNHRKIRDIAETNWEDGSYQIWVDNNHIAYMDMADGGKTYIVNINGEVAYGPYEGYLGHGDAPDGAIPLWVDKTKYPNGSNLGPNGIYIFKDGKITKAVDLEKDFGWLKAELEGSDNTDDWYMYHAELSPGGTHLAIRLDTGKDMQNLLTCKIDGTDVKLFPGKKPLHQQWYDDSTLFGHDNYWNNLPYQAGRRWDRDGNVLETLSGVGCHLGISPDKRYLASETLYQSNPIVLRLYRVGSIEPLAILSSESPGNVWSMRTHLNPSFSRDGKKVYFNKPIGDMVQLYRVDISNVIATQN
ncbi:MAG: hypothetical protein BWY15_00305 [Firmicutes bacterium ADurb.Bin193]|nr:MAG: hypothetical protein BWY15_00305 [Firmicutes bacterium ADurb.Bin193]